MTKIDEKIFNEALASINTKKFQEGGAVGETYDILNINPEDVWYEGQDTTVPEAVSGEQVVGPNDIIIKFDVGESSGYIDDTGIYPEVKKSLKELEYNIGPNNIQWRTHDFLYDFYDGVPEKEEFLNWILKETDTHKKSEKLTEWWEAIEEEGLANQFGGNIDNFAKAFDISFATGALLDNNSMEIMFADGLGVPGKNSTIITAPSPDIGQPIQEAPYKFNITDVIGPEPHKKYKTYQDWENDMYYQAYKRSPGAYITSKGFFGLGFPELENNSGQARAIKEGLAKDFKVAWKKKVDGQYKQDKFFIGPVDNYFISQTSEGTVVHISNKDMDLVTNWDNYYDTSTIRTAEGDFPIINSSDFYSNYIESNFELWLRDGAGLSDNSGRDITKLTSDKYGGNYVGDKDMRQRGVPILRLVYHASDGTRIEMGGKEFIERIQNGDTAGIKKWAQMQGDENPYITFTDANGDEEKAFLKEILEAEANLMTDFRKEFGPFRYAMNKSINELSTPENMERLKSLYLEEFNMIWDGNEDTKWQASADALKTVIGPEIWGKLSSERVKIPGFFHDVGLQESWMDYNLGITNPDLDREAMMFHNDGFKTFISSFGKYIETGEKPSGKIGLDNFDITPEDYYENPTKVHEAFSGLFSSEMNRISGGKPVIDDGIIKAQEANILTNLLKEEMHWTHTGLHRGGFKNSHIPYANVWWAVQADAVLNLNKAFRTKSIANFFPGLREAFGKKGVTSKALGLGKAFVNKARMFPTFELGKTGDFTKRLKNLKIRGTGALGFYAWLGTGGYEFVTDFSGGLFSLWGMTDSDWTPVSETGHTFARAFNPWWEPDAGELGWKTEKWEDAEKTFVTEKLNWIDEQLFNFNIWEQPEETAITFNNIANDYRTIFTNFSQTIVEGYNEASHAKTNMDTIGQAIHKQITESESYLALTDEKEKNAFYLQSFYELAFFDENLEGNNYNGKPYDYNGQVKKGNYSSELRKYIISHNTHEGALNLYRRFKLGEDGMDLVLREVPRPDSFPPELWEDLINFSTMSGEELLNLYPDSDTTSYKTNGKYRDYRGMSSLIDATHNPHFTNFEVDKILHPHYLFDYGDYGGESISSNGFDRRMFSMIRTNSENVFGIESLRFLSSHINSFINETKKLDAGDGKKNND